MIAGGIKRILQMVHLQPRSLHDPKKSESSVNHFEERILEKCSSHGIFFFESCMVSVFSFLLITISNQKTFFALNRIFSKAKQYWINIIFSKTNWKILYLSDWILRFENGCNKVVTELCVMQFWSEIILLTTNETRSARLFDFEITRIISDQIYFTHFNYTSNQSIL